MFILIASHNVYIDCKAPPLSEISCSFTFFAEIQCSTQFGQLEV